MKKQILFAKLKAGLQVACIYLAIAVCLLVSIPFIFTGILALLLGMLTVGLCAFGVFLAVKKPLTDYKDLLDLTGEDAPDYFAQERVVRLVGDARYVINLEDMICARCFPEYVSISADRSIIVVTYRKDGCWNPGWTAPEEKQIPAGRLRFVTMSFLRGTNVLSECHALSAQSRNFGHYADKDIELDYALRINGKTVAHCDRDMISAIWDGLSGHALTKSRYLSDVTDAVNSEAFG